MSAKTNKWSDVQVGDKVTNRGRHGVGQPVITGKLHTILAYGDCLVELPDGRLRHRSIRNLKKV